MISPQTIVVLGSNSFTGSAFIHHVLQNTTCEVYGLSRSPEYHPLMLPYKYKGHLSARFRFIRADVNRDFDTVASFLDETRPDVIVNYAAQGEVRNSWKWPEQWYQTNCMGVVRLANHLKDREYLKRYVSISTPEVYGSTERNLKENSTFRPSTPYASSKLSADLFLGALHKHCEFPVVYTRSANVYGIHQQLYRIIPRSIILLKAGKPIRLHGRGSAIRAFIHVRDVADATFRIIQSGGNGEVYHLAPIGEETSIRNLVKLICSMMGKDFASNTIDTNEHFGQDAMYSLDSTKIRSELNWDTTVNLHDGIKEMIAWIEEHWASIKEMPLDYVHKE